MLADPGTAGYLGSVVPVTMARHHRLHEYTPFAWPHLRDFPIELQHLPREGPWYPKTQRFCWWTTKSLCASCSLEYSPRLGSSSNRPITEPPHCKQPVD